MYLELNEQSNTTNTVTKFTNLNANEMFEQKFHIEIVTLFLFLNKYCIQSSFLDYKGFLFHFKFQDQI